MYYLLLFGDAYLEDNQYTKAISYYQKGLKKTPVSDNKQLAEISQDIANGYYKNKETKIAIYWYEKSLDHLSLGKYKDEELSARILIAKLQGNYGDYESSKEQLQTALNLAKSVKKYAIVK